MQVTGITVAGIPPISDRITLQFDERVNLFVGPNASGKSVILKWIASHIANSVPDAWIVEYLTEVTEGIEYRSVNYLGVSEDWRDEMASIIPEIPPPIISIGAVREPLPGLSDLKNNNIQSETAEEILNGAFSGAKVQQAIATLTKEVLDIVPDDVEPYVTLKGKRILNLSYPERRSFSEARRITDECIKSICGEVIRGSSSYNFIPGPDVRGALLGPRGADLINVHLDMGVDTNDIRNFDNLSYYEAPSESAYYQDADSLPLYAGWLSSGTQTTLLWVRWLVLKMVSHYRFRLDWEEMPAILLIDEIENHLHPTWQRRVIPALLEHFPGLQIFATTHSPFVVAGRKAGQVHLLNRDTNGVITASTNTEDVVGWTADEILRTLMGVDDPTDYATAAAARELRQLRDAGPSADAGEEERRQGRMQELRRLVDRDLLAGGPMAAQRELFEQQFAEALEKYQQSRDLNQEGG